MASDADPSDVDTASDRAPDGDVPVDTVPADVEPDQVAEAPLDVVAFLTAPYTFDERSLRVAALQQALNVRRRWLVQP